MATETERTCVICACFIVCSRIAVDFQMRQKWNGNNEESILRANGNGHGDKKDFFSFMASECEFFPNGSKTNHLVDKKQPSSGGP